MTSNVFNSSKLTFCYKPNKHRRMRVADILLRDEDGDGGGGSVPVDGDKGLRGAVCGGGVIGRWLRRLREKKGSVGSGKIGKAKERVESGDGSVPTRCSTNCSTGGNETCSGFEESNDGSVPSGSFTKETAFNLGVGFSLLYLIAHSKNELDKMTELRTQMESFLQVTKEELQRKDAVSKLSEPHDNVAYSTTDIPEGSNSNSNLSVQFSAASYAIPESGTILECDQDSPKPEYSVEGMIRLEEELEAELERLQLHLDTETLSDHPQLQRLEVTVKDSAPVESHSTSSGEVIDPHESNGGVPPYILERRLRELLESRQEDHIRELEAALKCFQRKLHEKELELSWWKDRARLISQHAPAPSTSCFTCSP